MMALGTFQVETGAQDAALSAWGADQQEVS